jgi:hypothetical protein
VKKKEGKRQWEDGAGAGSRRLWTLPYEDVLEEESKLGSTVRFVFHDCPTPIPPQAETWTGFHLPT